MRVIYIYHSGFVIDADNCIIIIDFYKDTEGDKKGIVHENILTDERKLYVLSSHSHFDHFNPDILTWKNRKSNIQYILSSDIQVDYSVDIPNVSYLDKLNVYIDDFLEIKAFGSTDIGISFLIKCGGKSMFHAGDLNNWHWNEESTIEEINEAESAYLRELGLLKDETTYLDVVMFPVDPRLGKDYMRGAIQFLDNIQVGLFAPMHFGEDNEKANAFGKHAVLRESAFFSIKQKGDSILF